MLSNNRAERKGLSRKEASDLKKLFKFSEEIIKDDKGDFRARDKDGDPRSERAIQLTEQRRHRGPELCQKRAGEGREGAEAVKEKVAPAVKVEVTK